MYNQNYPYMDNNDNDNWYVPPEFSHKKSFLQRMRNIFLDRRYRRLMALGVLAGMGVLIYYIFSNSYFYILLKNKTLNAFYTDNILFKLVIETLYSLTCVALPFFLVFLLMRKLGIYDEPLPFGRPKGGIKIFLLILSGLGVCFIGNLISNVFYSRATAAGIEFYSYARAAQAAPIPENAVTAIFMTLHTALTPALTEEFAFRGVVMQPLRKYGDWFAIIVSSIIFGLVHGNVMQAPFAITAGIALGYIAIVTDSLWTCAALHFFNNLISLVYSTSVQFVDGMREKLLSAIIVYGFIFTGLLAFAGYVSENRNFVKLRPGKYPKLKHRTAIYFLMPTMLAGIALTLWTTLNDIVGFAEIFRKMELFAWKQ